MKAKMWATKITMHNLIYEIARREVRGDYDGAQALRDVFSHDIDKSVKEAIKANKESMRDNLIQEVYTK